MCLNKNYDMKLIGDVNIDNEYFEELLELNLLDIKSFLDSYRVDNVDAKNIDSTIKILKLHMPK